MTSGDPSIKGYCPYCGQAIKPEGRFCSACGKKVPKSKAPGKHDWHHYIRWIVITAVGFIIVLWVFSSDFRRNYILARLGWHRAQYIVGTAYKSGRSVSQSYDKASKWFKLSADAGFAPAQFEYGVLRLYGLGTEEDRDEALGYIRKAGDEGIPEAQFLAGVLLLDSSSEPEAVERREAEQWLRLAAEKGYTPAEYCLAKDYIAGSRLRENFIEADILLKDLGDQGFKPAEKLRDYLRKSLMTPDQESLADKREAEHGGPREEPQ